MAALLLNSGECGPVNPLNTLSKTFQRDRGVQQDRFAPVAGPSGHAFRSQPDASSADPFQDAAPFDLAPLNRALDVHTPVPAWAIDFQTQKQPPKWAQDFQAFSPGARTASPMTQSSRVASPMPVSSASAPMNASGSMMYQRPLYRPPLGVAAPAPTKQEVQPSYNESGWETAFQSHTISTPLRQASPPLVQNLRTPESDAALAKTAAELLVSVSGERNEKFAQSDFMNLMRKFKNYEAVVDGNAVIDQEPHQVAEMAQQARSASTAAQKGKMRAPNQARAEEARLSKDEREEATEKERPEVSIDEMQMIWDSEYLAREEEQAEREEAFRNPQQPDPRFFQGDGGFVPEEDELYDDRFDPANIIGRPFEPAEIEATRRAERSNQDHWSHLQQDWDAYEATATGFRSREEAAQEAMNAPIDELKRQVEATPQNAQAWLQLGIREQENEREQLAIAALTKAVELDPTNSQAWLALAISYVNENNRELSYDAIACWIGSRKDYADQVATFRALQGSPHGVMSQLERCAHMTSTLIYLAQATVGQPVDADLQIALGVLFNSADDYEKAGDCFAAALTVRPEDHLLYNRLGATLANSGRNEDATQYYFEALRLEPSYARARFNLAVSYIAMSRYRDAADQLLIALAHQNAIHGQDQGDDADVGRDSGPMSEVLWDTLATCSTLLGQHDLTQACGSKDLGAFKAAGFAF